MIRLLVGLGNPGVEYEGTRHNAGFWWLEAATRQLGASLQMQGSWFGLAGRVNRPEAAGGALWLLQPMTYMNNSGKAVAALARFYKIAPAEILVAHDELDLQPGQVKIKCGGSPGGNGIRDVAAQLGAADFWRLRLGIGHPGVKAEVINYVLRKPPGEQREAIDKIIAATVAELPLLLAGEMERAMGKVNAKPPRPKPPRPAPAPAEPPAADGGQKP